MRDRRKDLRHQTCSTVILKYSWIVSYLQKFYGSWHKYLNNTAILIHSTNISLLILMSTATNIWTIKFKG